ELDGRELGRDTAGVALADPEDEGHPELRAGECAVLGPVVLSVELDARTDHVSAMQGGGESLAGPRSFRRCPGATAGPVRFGHGLSLAFISPCRPVTPIKA